MIGRTLSHFRITAKLGEGGMGEVYRAEDSKLGREVAIKILPEAVNSDPERLMRTFDVTPDGKRIVFDRLSDDSDIVLIELPRAEPSLVD